MRSSRFAGPTFRRWRAASASRFWRLGTGSRAILSKPEVTDGELANAYGTTGQLFLVYSLADSAETALTNAARLDPEEFRWAYYLGAFYQQDGQVEPAIDALETARALRSRDLPTLIRLAQTYLSGNRLDDSAEVFSEVLAIDPENPAASYGLGRIAMRKDDPETASRFLTAAITVQPEATSVHYQLAMAYRDLGEMERARGHLEKQGPGEVRFDDPLMQDLGSFAQGGSLLLFSATHARAAGDLEAAILAFRKAIEADPTNNATRLSLSSTLIQKGDLAAAQEVLEEAIRYEPESSSAHYNLGLIHRQRDETTAALEHVGRAAELAPDFVDAQLNYALLLQEAGRYPEAEQRYARAAELDPTDPQIRFRHATVLLQLGRAEEAIAELEGALSAAPDSVDGQLLMARALGVERRFGEASAHFARVLELDPTHSEALFGRSLALLLAEMYPEALAYLESVLEGDPNNLAIQHILARLLATCPDDSIRDGARGLDLAEEVIAADLTIEHAETVAMALAETGRFDEAAALQRQIIAQAETTASANRIAGLRRNLLRYQSRQPVRAPWLG